jgi:hypothetical protein
VAGDYDITTGRFAFERRQASRVALAHAVLPAKEQPHLALILCVHIATTVTTTSARAANIIVDLSVIGGDSGHRASARFAARVRDVRLRASRA